MSQFNRTTNQYKNSKKYSNENNFRNKTKKEFKISVNEFPNLLPEIKVLEKNDKSSMDFKSAALIEKVVVETLKNSVKPGYVRLTYENGKSGKIKKEFEDVEHETIYSTLYEEPFSIRVERIMNNLIQNWYDYKNTYIDLFGEYIYEKYYGLQYEINDEELEAELEAELEKQNYIITPVEEDF
jgi:hypothetical protein